MNKFLPTIKTSGRLIKLMFAIDPWLSSLHLITVLIPAFMPLVIAYVFKLLIDEIVRISTGQAVNYQYIGLVLGIGLAAYIFQSLNFSIQDYIGRLYWNKIPISLFQTVLSKISGLDISYFEDSDFKNTLEKVRDTYVWRPLNMLENLEFALQGLVQVLASAVVLYSLGPWTVAVILIAAIPALLSHLKEAELNWGIWSSDSPHRKKFWYVSEMLQDRQSIKEMKLFQLPKIFLDELRALQTRYYNESKKLSSRYFVFNFLFGVVDTLAFVGIMVFIIFQALAQKVTIGDISYYSSVIQNFSGGVNGLFRNITKLFEESLYVSSVFEVLDAQNKIVIPANPKKVDFTSAPTIEFKDVTFSYNGRKSPALKNFSLIIKPGEKIALVGENGAGKTTLVKLLMRFYDVDSGAILINGVDIKELDINEWYKAVGVLFQDFVKYEYPAQDNIYFGKAYEAFNLEKIQDAAKRSGADPVIKKLEKGYETMLGRTFEEGVELSAGQWQKVALARAFLRDAPLLILDEPTAAVDAKAESEIFSKVEKLSKQKTVIIISHRFSTVRNADKIYVIDDGGVKESGSHQELMKLDGQYANLFNLQAKGYK